MNKNLNSTTELTEFAPLSPEPEDSPRFTHLLSRFFKRSGNDSKTASNAPVENKAEANSASGAKWDSSEPANEPLNLNVNSSDQLAVVAKDGRSLPNVLKRISNLLALKYSGLQSYKDTDLKQYWMPDSVSKECYDCGEKFTTFRRRHHCRVCGQIFCSRCCNQEIPGKIMGCTGDLRVCTYCGKVVLSYLQSADMNADLSADLRALQEDLQVKFGGELQASDLGVNLANSAALAHSEQADAARRKPSVAYQEERFAQARVHSGNCLAIEERCRILQSSRSLRLLHEELANPCNGLVVELTIQKRVHQTCFSGSELVEWLLKHNKVVVREQGRALGQALLEAGYLESLTMGLKEFSDGYTLYRLRSCPPSPSPSVNSAHQQQQQQQHQQHHQHQQGVYLDQPNQDISPTPTLIPMSQSSGDPDSEEMMWYSQTTQQDSTTTDSESEMSLPSSASLFHLDLNLEENTVHISRPNPTTPSPRPTKRSKSNSKTDIPKAEGVADNYIRDVVQLYRNSSNDKFRAVNWNKASSQSDDSRVKQVFETLTSAFKQHNQNFLKQLLNAEGLSQSWADVVIPVAQQVVDTIKPDLRNDENMDIRQYVQLKKVPGGSRSECCIVGGVVCSKNVAHRSMNAKLLNPRILLLSCAIMYQRVEGRFMSLEPILLQEQEYLRHVVTRIAAMSPTLVLVQKNVSRLAQESLLALGITLVLNVKPSVLERVAKVTRADIVTSVDAHVGRPQLGTCRYFHIETYTTDTGGAKTLMFMEGCPVPHHGCTVLLRGGTLHEMAKLKRVVNRMIFSLYNWRLEVSFLMDEFANPPRPPDMDTFFDESNTALTSQPPAELNVEGTVVGDESNQKGNEEDLNLGEKNSEGLPLTDSAASNVPSTTNRVRKHGVDHPVSPIENKENLTTNVANLPVDSSKLGVNLTTNVISESPLDNSKLGSVKLKTTNVSSSKDKSFSDDRKINVESVSDFSDPLHLYLNFEDEVFGDNSSQALAVAELPVVNKFRKALDDTILCISPFIKVPVPYLETETGRNCELRKYLPEEIFWSAQISDDKSGSQKNTASDSQSAENRLQGIKLAPKHPFTTAKLTQSADTADIQTLLANFRACGGRLPRSSSSSSSSSSHSTSNTFVLPPPPSASVLPPPLLDALDPSNHQKLAMLFCSYSHHSNNAPAFCVNPWVVHMDFYGRNDIPLGDFLEKYCFRKSYFCPSKTCDTPMVQHIRRFVHSGGAVHIALQELETAPTDDENILMWNSCPITKLDSPVMVLSNDTWAFSFAKYLELRFHGDMYTPRGGAMETKCDHSLHHNHIQYFGYKNMVAFFKYTKILVWEISLPPSLLLTQSEPYHQNYVLDEMKKWAVAGHEVFSGILNRLCNMGQNGGDAITIAALKQQLQKDQTVFKSRVDEIQMKMTSPTLEDSPDTDSDMVKMSMWKLCDSLVLLKRLVAESVADWNARLLDLESSVRRRDERAKKNSTEQRVSVTAAAGLTDIIEGVITSHFPDTQADLIPIEETVHPSQLSMSTSMCSEPEVAMETDELQTADATSTAAAVDNDDGTEDQPAFTLTEGQAAAGRESTAESDAQLNLVESHGNVVKTESKVPRMDDVLKEVSTVQTDRTIDTEVNESPAEPDEGEAAANAQHGSKADKKTVKTILSQLLPTQQIAAPIQSPMSPQEHHCLPLGVSVPVVVYEREPSSIIAYALSCHDYRIDLEELRNSNKGPPSEQPSPSPVNKRKSGTSESMRESISEAPSTHEHRRTGSGMLSFLRAAASNNNLGNSGTSISRQNSEIGQSSSGALPSEGPSPQPQELDENRAEPESNKSKSAKSLSSLHLEVQFSDSCANFIVKVYFAEQFARLRAAVFPAGEEAFVRSLSRCVQWAARGGKSGSNFCKTKDDRFILKEMTRLETQLFVESASNYFEYMEGCVATNTPTLLGKIVGVYRVIYRNATSSNTLRSNLLVMENLFHARSVKHKFDLKGSVRNRLVNPNEQEGEIVLLDENLLNRSCDSPLYIQPHAKTVLMQAIHQDTQFLAAQCVMDYSLLVGLDETKKELVVGIIDYIRTFTWDKKLETMVKRSGLLGGQGKQPTIVSPDEYRDRFIAAMHKYFLPVPDRWTGLGKGLDC
ncbi:putative 1-phosphatidylinositol 3-phosphate 5-kinase [Nilaparvata lugens]|uniref:putative 1-phosphatidylinositol 3-phosphate 5-kinase n=1 Tax=Nilaparvata lugens TaxID=108931 RepID=UPI00193E360E|nr:putative 1-phosphatidylinositol 3-phosphate 5-kinase [Nilaparvata lugens]